MSAAALRRAHRWFWALATTAVCASGALYEGLRAAPGPATGLLVLVSALVLAVSAVQAARILALLAGRPRPPRAAARTVAFIRDAAPERTPKQR